MLHAYNLRIDRVESRIVLSLRTALSAAHKATDMFAVFSKFNALFIRPRIRGAISEYQDVLIEQVMTDIEALAGCLRDGYGASVERKMDKLRDIPPVAGHIVWARQLASQLEGLMQRVEDVLGSSWALNVHGKKLKQDGDNLREKLKTEPVFAQWVDETNKALASFAGPDHMVSSAVFSIQKRGTSYVLSVAFDERLIVLFKEVRNLVWLGFRAAMPMPITLLSSGVRQVYPSVVALRQLVRTYNQCAQDVTEAARPLVQAQHKAVQAIISASIRLRWNSLSRLQPLVSQLTTAVTAFKSAVTHALEATAIVDGAIEQLRTCAYDHDAFKKQLETLQKQADALDLAKHSNLRAWAASVSVRVEGVLTEQLGRALDAFSAALGYMEVATAAAGGPAGGLPPATTAEARGTSPPFKLSECRFAIVVRNGTMTLEPPLPEARVQLLRQLCKCMQVVVTLPALQAGRYSMASSSARPASADYSHLLSRVAPATLQRVYGLVEAKVAAAAQYVQQWLRYQGLWDMDASVYAFIGEDLTQWQALLVQLKEARQLFEGGLLEWRVLFGNLSRVHLSLPR